MQVDWITVAAQIINFLVLVWLLKRFLYGPIVRAMDEREAGIAEKMRAADKEQEMAEAESTRYREMQRELEGQREQLVRTAHIEADDLSKSLQIDARQQVANQRAEWLADMSAEQTDFLDDLRERSGEAFAQMTRRAFHDLASADLNDQITQRFNKVLRDLSGDELERIKTIANSAEGKVVVRSGFDLSAGRRNELSSTIRELIAADANIVFELSPAIICGVELRVGGQLVRWSLDGFLDDMENELREALKTRVPTVASEAME